MVEKMQLYEVLVAMMEAVQRKDPDTFENLKRAFDHIKQRVAFVPGEFEHYDNCAYFCQSALQVAPEESKEHIRNALYYFAQIVKP